MIPANVTYIGYGAFTGSRTKFTNIVVDENNKNYYSQNNCIIRKSDKLLIIGCRNSVVPNDVTSIQDYAFSGVSPTEITIPNTVTSIGSYCFFGCAFASITIPNSVTSIGQYAFRSCSKLTSATFENTSGWKAGETTLSSDDLSNTSTAATYLVSTYATAEWRRS